MQKKKEKSMYLDSIEQYIFYIVSELSVDTWQS